MKYIPHAYQAYCERQIVEKPALALWLDMGLGKTSITLSAVNELKFNRFEVRKVLVIAAEKSGRGHLAGRGSKVGPYEASSVLHGAWRFTKTDPGCERAGRPVRH